MAKFFISFGICILINVTSILSAASQAQLFAADYLIAGDEKELAEAVAFETEYVKMLESHIRIIPRQGADRCLPNNKSSRVSYLTVRPCLGFSISGNCAFDSSVFSQARLERVKTFPRKNDKQHAVSGNPGVLVNLGEKWKLLIEGRLSQEKGVFFSGGCEF